MARVGHSSDYGSSGSGNVCDNVIRCKGVQTLTTRLSIKASQAGDETDALFESRHRRISIRIWVSRYELAHSGCLRCRRYKPTPLMCKDHSVSQIVIPIEGEFPRQWFGFFRESKSQGSLEMTVLIIRRNRILNMFRLYQRLEVRWSDDVKMTWWCCDA